MVTIQNQHQQTHKLTDIISCRETIIWTICMICGGLASKLSFHWWWQTTMPKYYNPGNVWRTLVATSIWPNINKSATVTVIFCEHLTRNQYRTEESTTTVQSVYTQTAEPVYNPDLHVALGMVSSVSWLSSGVSCLRFHMHRSSRCRRLSLLTGLANS